MGLLDASSTGFQSLRLGHMTWGINTSLPREKLHICEIPFCLWVTTQGMGFLVGLHLYLSYLSQCGSFILCCGWVSFQVLPRGNCSICSCRFVVSMEGDESGPYYAAILNPLIMMCFALLCLIIFVCMLDNVFEKNYLKKQTGALDDGIHLHRELLFASVRAVNPRPS